MYALSRHENAGDIPTPLALVGNQSGFIEQRRDANDLNQVRFLASRAQRMIGTQGFFVWHDTRQPATGRLVTMSPT